MKTTLTANPHSFPTQVKEHAHISARRSRLASPARTFGLVGLILVALCLALRVAMAFSEVDRALDSAAESMKYLRADGRVANF